MTYARAANTIAFSTAESWNFGEHCDEYQQPLWAYVFVCSLHYRINRHQFNDPFASDNYLY